MNTAFIAKIHRDKLIPREVFPNCMRGLYRTKEP